MRGDPELFARLLDALADMALASLRAQVRAGASAVQLFDSWVGALSPADYERHVLPATPQGPRRPGRPRACRASTSAWAPASCCALMAGGRGRRRRGGLAGAARRGPAAYRARATRVQGNLDPTTCLAPWDVVEAQARDVLARGGGIGHIFNLGHGVLPETDPDVLEPPRRPRARHSRPPMQPRSREAR